MRAVDQASHSEHQPSNGSPAANETPGTRVRVAVDIGPAFGNLDGIGRYLTNLVGRMYSDRYTSREWLLSGRGSLPVAMLQASALHACPSEPGRSAVTSFADSLPNSMGRSLPLGSSQIHWLHRHRPDLYWNPAHRLPMIVLAQTARVVTIHDLCWRVAPATMRLPSYLLDKTLMPRSLRMADQVIAVSQATRHALLQIDPSLGEKSVVAHEAAETLPEPATQERLNCIGVDSHYVLFVGSREPRKNLSRLTEAFAELPSVLRHKHQFVIAGGRCWGGVDVPQMAKRLGIADRVRVLGSVDDQLLAKLYRHARCLAMPSLHEGFGLPVVEALSQGTPALIASGSPLPEVAGDAGLVVDPLSVDSIRARLEAMLTDYVLHARLAAAAIPQASKFSLERAARETLAVFEETIAVRKEKIRLGLV